MALQFKKCKTCGRIFQTTYGFECPDCIEDRERKFTIVKDYLYENSTASMEEIVRETEVDEKLVLRFLKEGRLEMTNNSGLLTCEKCGVPISSGTMCKNCKDSLSKAMDSVLPATGGKDKKPLEIPGGFSNKAGMHVGLKGK